MNEKMPPFDNVKVRRAIAYAIPYQKIMDVALFNKARPMFGGPEADHGAKWPQPSPYDTDLAKAKALLAEPGSPMVSRRHFHSTPALQEFSNR